MVVIRCGITAPRYASSESQARRQGRPANAPPRAPRRRNEPRAVRAPATSPVPTTSAAAMRARERHGDRRSAAERVRQRDRGDGHRQQHREGAGAGQGRERVPDRVARRSAHAAGPRPRRGRGTVAARPGSASTIHHPRGRQARAAPDAGDHPASAATAGEADRRKRGRGGGIDHSHPARGSSNGQAASPAATISAVPAVRRPAANQATPVTAHASHATRGKSATAAPTAAAASSGSTGGAGASVTAATGPCRRAPPATVRCASRWRQDAGAAGSTIVGSGRIRVRPLRLGVGPPCAALAQVAHGSAVLRRGAVPGPTPRRPGSRSRRNPRERGHARRDTAAVAAGAAARPG